MKSKKISPINEPKPKRLPNPNLVNDPEALWDEFASAELLGITPRTLQSWRISGGGPVYIKISARCVRYRRADLVDFISKRRQTSTSESAC